MNCFTIERFREEGFQLKEFLEEVYEECRRRDGTTCDRVISDLKAIKEAISYKESELKDKKIYFADKASIEELSNLLSSIDLARDSIEFVRISKERDSFLKRNRFIEYFTAVEKNTLMDILDEKEERLQEIVEFIEALTEFNEVNRQRIEEEGRDSKNSSDKKNSSAPDSHGDGETSATELQNGSPSEMYLSDTIQGRLDRYRKKLLSQAMKSYASAIEKNLVEQAKKSAVICYRFGHIMYPIEHLVKNQKPLPYPSIIITEIDLLKENTLHELVKYLEEAQGEIEEKIELIKDLIINNQYIRSSMLSNPLKGEEGPGAKGVVEVFETVRKLLSTFMEPPISSLNSIRDPVEYLVTAETITTRTSIIKNRIYHILPDIKDKIVAYSVFNVSEEDLFKKEEEAINIVVNGLVNSIKTGKSTLKYKLNGEVITLIKTPVEAVFKYMAFCNRMALRSSRLLYSSKAMDQIYQSQLLGFTLLLNTIFSSKYAPYLGTNLHLSVYICIKTFYKKLLGKYGTKGISKIISQLNKEENNRNREIFNSEMVYLINKLQEHLVEYKSEETVELLTKAFAHLESTPILNTVVNETLEIFYTKLKERAFTRTTLSEVKSMLEYVKVLHKSIKPLKTETVEKKIRKMKVLLEGILVDREDLDRILDIAKATHEEEEIIKRIRDRVSRS